MDYPRLSDDQRLQLESQRTEEWSPSQMGVWFGAEAPPAGTEVPDYYYEISPEDREVLEQAIADTQSEDAVRQAAAREALLAGLRVGGGLGDILAFGGEQIMNLLGFGVLAEFGDATVPIKNGYVRIPSECGEPGEVSARAAVTNMNFNALSDGSCEVSVRIIRQNLRVGWFEDRFGASETVHMYSGAAGFQIEGERDILMVGGEYNLLYDSHPGCGAVQDFAAFEEFGRSFDFGLGSSGRVRWCIQDHLEESTKECGPWEEWTRETGIRFEASPPEFIRAEPAGSRDPDKSDTTVEQTKEIIKRIKEDPNYKDHLRDQCEGSGAGPGGTPIGGGGYGGPGGPGTYGPGGPPLGGGGGKVRFPTNPPGYRDPTQPGGIGKPWQPGKRVCMDLGDGERYCGNIGRVTPPGFPRYRPPGGIGGGRFPGPGRFPRPGGGFPGGPPGGGPEIDLEPPISPGPHKFGKKTCFRGRPDDIIRSILDSMGADMTCVVFDSPTDVRIFPAVCFGPKVDKRVALNYFLDRAGWGIFPSPDGCLIIGVDDPLDIHFYYHENVDLIAFELEWDRYEAFRTVIVNRPDKRNRAGRLIEKGESLPFTVPNPVAAPPDSIHEIEVPWGTPRAEMVELGRAKARRLSRLALPRISFNVPLNNRIRQRHQIHIRQPSLDFDQTFIVTEVGKEVTMGENGSALTNGIARYIVPEVSV